MILPIRQNPDPILREKSKPLETFGPTMRKLANDMLDTLKFHKALGLSAVQVGAPVRMIVLNANKLGMHNHWVLINPGIGSYTRETTTAAEGCLSINKGIPSFNVRRARSIRIVAYDRAEQEVYLEVFGMGARVVQHEMDHLDGKLILDFAELIRA